ncbi:MAG: helicase-related protein, partial [Vicinamibacterales bacterium]
VLAGATPSWTSLRAAARAHLALFPYQLEPALAMMRGLACRILLADEVGLGKTIQAGLIVAELVERERDARVLVVTPASLRDQWRDELRDRFAVHAEVIDAAGLARAASDLPAGVNPWAIPHVAITSIDFLKRPDVIRSLEPLVWDLVAFDEAHALSGRSDRATAAELLAARARRVLIITATPHSGDERAFDRLRALGRIGPADPLLTFRRSRGEAGLARDRAMRRLAISPTPEEALVHRALAAYAARVSRDAPSDRRAAARLAMSVLERRASSSAASLARSVERRMALLRDTHDAAGAQLRLPIDEGYLSEDDEPAEELAAPGLPDQAAEHRWLEHLLALARAVRAESKIAALRRLLRRAGEPALVFTEYRDTLRQVAALLGGNIAILHGGLTTAERAREARRFTHGDARILLATDAASEGLNLHHRCRLVVNLDVPWTPLRLEQRVGRVDRLGQVRRVHAVTFMAAGTADVTAASGLAARSAQAEHDAPFGSTDDAGATLRADARAEAARLQSVRALTGPYRARPAIHPRPVVTLIDRRARPPGLWLALRLLFVDSTGAIVWETLKGLSLDAARPSDRSSRRVRGCFDESVRANAHAIAGVSAFLHDATLATLRSELETAMSPLVAREQRILDQLGALHGRLAAPLLQLGLFDRRAARDLDALQRVAEEAAARARDRIHQLERRREAAAGERCLAFGVTWSG